jgi:hypothetical protein
MLHRPSWLRVRDLALFAVEMTARRSAPGRGGSLVAAAVQVGSLESHSTGTGARRMHDSTGRKRLRTRTQRCCECILPPPPNAGGSVTGGPESFPPWAASLLSTVHSPLFGTRLHRTTPLDCRSRTWRCWRVVFTGPGAEEEHGPLEPQIFVLSSGWLWCLDSGASNGRSVHCLLSPCPVPPQTSARSTYHGHGLYWYGHADWSHRDARR